MKNDATRLSPFATGIKGRCPKCGEGRLFNGYLKVTTTCDQCGLDLSFAESGDGPAIFIMFVVGMIVIALAMITDSLFHPAPYVHLMLWIPTTIVLSLVLLRPFKATMIALQYRHDAREARTD